MGRSCALATNAACSLRLTAVGATSRCFRRTFVLDVLFAPVLFETAPCAVVFPLVAEPLLELFPGELFDDVVAGFFFCALVLELCAYPTVIAAHSIAPVTNRQPNPEPLLTTST
jgi:hypothetical protein